jgi:ribokinase
VVAGGKGANQAVAAARDGRRVMMFGCVGGDGFAGIALESLRGADVDVSGVATVAEPTGCAAICVDAEGENQIAVASGANRLARANQVPDALLGPATTVLLQMEVPAEENASLIERARDTGARIVLNLAPAAALAVPALRALDLLVVNEGEGAWLAEAIGASASTDRSVARALARRLGVTAIVTRGPAGVEVAEASGQDWSIPALPITPVDTTAAGDAFVGVLAGALDAGAGLEGAVRRASVAAGLACLVVGAQSSLPRRAEIDRRLADLPS